MEETFIAVYQDGYAIFGIGNTVEEAIEDAKNDGIDEPDELEDEIADSNSNFIGDMIIINISKAVKEEVERIGGDVVIIKCDDGVYRLHGEVEEE